jgi:phage-related protein (TIGR01555 family)
LNPLRLLADGLLNAVSGLGTARDKRIASTYSLNILDDAAIAAAYRSSWLPRKIVDVPALDSCRAWRNWQASSDEIEKIEAEEKRLNVKGKVLRARKLARLHGGSAIMIGDGTDRPDLPLAPDSMRAGKLKYLTVLKRRELQCRENELDAASEFFGRPHMYVLRGKNGVETLIHPSRLVLFFGDDNPDDDIVSPTMQGWGESVLQAIYEAIQNADSTAANIASLIFEGKIDVIKIPGLSELLATDAGEQRFQKRLLAASTAKGNHGTFVMDGGEEYDQKTMSFGGLTDILMAFMQIVSGAADIPVTRLLGQSPAGMNATGESDIRNYYDRIGATQNVEMTPAMARMDECLIRSALGSRPPEVHYIWAPLWQITSSERAEIGDKIAGTIEKLNNTGLFPREALQKVAANTLVEHSVLPGLEDALEEFGTEVPEVDLGQDDIDDPASNVVPLRRAQQDAAPRTLYVQRKVKNAADIIAWAKGQGFTTTLDASDLHVTIAYSRTPVDWFKVGESWSPELKIGAGGPRQMEQFGEATVLLFTASELRWRHSEIREAGASWDHDEYQPHITVSYGFDGDLSAVEPYQGEIILGPELFAEVDEDWKSGATEK